MIYVKSLLAGLAALIVFVALIAGVFFFAPVVMIRLAPPADGGGGWILAAHGFRYCRS